MILEAIVQKYLNFFPEEEEKLTPLLAQIADDESLDNRKNFRGHIAGDGIVLSPDRTKLLLIHHNRLDRWLQPGGHLEPQDPNPLACAKREVREETGLEKFTLLEWQSDSPLVPIDIALDDVPNSEVKQEPRHFHHTFSYVFLAQTIELQYQEAEVSGARWTALNEASQQPQQSHLPLVINKLVQFKLI